jgi:hypothetical protein
MNQQQAHRVAIIKDLNGWRVAQKLPAFSTRPPGARSGLLLSHVDIVITTIFSPTPGTAAIGQEAALAGRLMLRLFPG